MGMAAAEFDIAGEDRPRADLHDFPGALPAKPADKPPLDKRPEPGGPAAPRPRVRFTFPGEEA